MKKTDSMITAVREVKRLSSNLEESSKIYLAYNEQHKDFFVSSDYDKIAEAIYGRWFESAFESDADAEAKKYIVWDYSLASNKEKLPRTYRNAKRSLIRSEQPLVRKSNDVNAHFSVKFIIKE